MVTREQKITQSVQDYVRDILFNRWAYPQSQVELLDSFPYRRFDGALDKNYVALGFNFDDGGKAAEMGSDFTHRIYTVEFFVFGTTSVWGSNLANAVKAALEQDSVIPLKDIGVEDEPVIDTLVVAPRGLRVQHMAMRDPRPWEDHLWLCRVNLEDFYHARLTG